MRALKIINNVVINVIRFSDNAELPGELIEDIWGASKGWVVVNGIPQAPIENNDSSFDEAFSNKRADIINRFKLAMTVITDTYTTEDIASFPTQENEANAWVADNEAETPFIDGLLANRPSVNKPTLVQRIIDNAATYKAVAGPVIGKKQSYEDLLYALKAKHEDPEQPDVTQDDFDEIVVDYSV